MSRRPPCATLVIVAATTLALSAPAVGADIGPDGTCTGAPITPTQTITGSFSSAQQGSYVMVPFDVPAGTTQVRTKLCYDKPPAGSPYPHTIDLGLWDAAPAGKVWGDAQFRGWGGSSHPDVQISPQGFSSEADYAAAPKDNVPGRTTRGFVPGAIPAGRWAAELGVAAVIPEDPDGVAWRLEIETSGDPAYAADPYRAAPYDTRPARAKAGWYAGDMHLHAEHSALGDAADKTVFDYAFGPAKLDFISLSDYVTTSGWGEIGRYQSQYPGKLVMRSAEVITYRGHILNHSSTYVDHRTGPVYDRAADGTLTLERAARPASSVFDAIHAAGGWTQINHPRIFPPDKNPLNAFLCRGCAWLYSDAETDFRKVDAIEVDTGPPAFGDQPNQFTIDGLAFYQHALASGAHIAAVGSSDDHHGGKPTNATQAPIGTATTVVYAKALSEQGIEAGVKAGHTYVKLFGNAGPDLRLTARSKSRRTAIMGDTLLAPSGDITATSTKPRTGIVPGAGAYTLILQRNGTAVKKVSGTGALTLRARPSKPGRYGTVLMRGPLIVAVSTPVWITPPLT